MQCKVSSTNCNQTLTMSHQLAVNMQTLHLHLLLIPIFPFSMHTFQYPAPSFLLLLMESSSLSNIMNGFFQFQTFSIVILTISMGSFFFLQQWLPISHSLSLLSFLFLLLLLLLLLLIIKPFLSKSTPIYLVDFSCVKPPSFCRIPFSSFVENISMFQTFDSESIDFMSKILHSSNISQETYLPPSLHFIPPKSHIQDSFQELQMSLFPVLTNLLSKTNLSPQNIDILIVNCSGFCPSPSLSSIIINKFSLKNDVKSFTLSGMGCSAGILAIDMAQNLLKVHKNSNAVILSTEVLSNGWYSGNEKSKLLLNCLFRLGSAAILLTNKKEARKSSKYKIIHTFRTQKAFDDKSYLSAIREEDSEGKLGVTLKRDLLQIAGEVLRSNISILGSSILPFSEKFRHGFSIIWKRYIDKSAEIYVPNFKSVIQHFCLPTSGKPVIREISKGLKLGERDMEAALMTFYRFGNQSSSSLWYELAYMEAKERVKKGDKVWQLGMGTGPKCNSVVLECVRDIKGEASNGPWADCVERFPVLSGDDVG